jgi:hypothetical protein
MNLNRLQLLQNYNLGNNTAVYYDPKRGGPVYTPNVALSLFGNNEYELSPFADEKHKKHKNTKVVPITHGQPPSTHINVYSPIWP